MCTFFIQQYLIMSKQINDNIPLFLLHLYRILNNQSFDEIIKWDFHRNGFIIIDKTKLTQQVLPQYYRHHNYCSFVRQLNMYGFRKARSKYNQAFFFNQQFSISMQFADLKNIKRKVSLKKQSNKENIDTFQQISNGKEVQFDPFIKIANGQQDKPYSQNQQPTKYQPSKLLQTPCIKSCLKLSQKLLKSLKMINMIEPLSALSIEQQIKQSERVEFCQSMKLLQSNKILFQRNQSISQQLIELKQFQ